MAGRALKLIAVVAAENKLVLSSTPRNYGYHHEDEYALERDKGGLCELTSIVWKHKRGVGVKCASLGDRVQGGRFFQIATSARV